MDGLPKLNFPAASLRIKRAADGSLSVWDSLRGRYLVLTPEEWVRRHLIAWLCSVGIPSHNICQEYPVDMNGASQRADVVVIGQSASPVLVVECKAPDVGLDSEVLGQAVRYNSVLAAPYVMITNGMSHRIYQRSGAGYVSLQELPPLF